MWGLQHTVYLGSQGSLRVPRTHLAPAHSHVCALLLGEPLLSVFGPVRPPPQCPHPVPISPPSLIHLAVHRFSVSISPSLTLPSAFPFLSVLCLVPLPSLCPFCPRLPLSVFPASSLVSLLAFILCLTASYLFAYLCLCLSVSLWLTVSLSRCLSVSLCLSLSCSLFHFPIFACRPPPHQPHQGQPLCDQPPFPQSSCGPPCPTCRARGPPAGWSRESAWSPPISCPAGPRSSRT